MRDTRRWPGRTGAWVSVIGVLASLTWHYGAAGKAGQLPPREQNARDRAERAAVLQKQRPAATPDGLPELRKLAPGYRGIIFTRMPAKTTPLARPIPEGNDARPGDGSKLALLLPDGTVRILGEDFYSAADPEVSFDGKLVLFSGKRGASDHWQVYEMEWDGTAVRQITHQSWDCRSPMYQSGMFELDALEPWREITFVGIRTGELDERGPYPVSNLYACKLDGSSPRQITFSPSSDSDPVMAPDGRIVYAGWQLRTGPGGAMARQALFGINLDGSDYALFAGDEGERRKRMPCVTADRQMVFVEGGSTERDGAGTLGAVLLRRPLHSYRKLTAAADGLFLSPSPLPSGGILVSRRTGASGIHGIFRFDPNTRRLSRIHSDPAWHAVQAKLVAPRPEPDGRASVVQEKEPAGVFYCLNVFTHDLAKREWLVPGVANRIRVIEGIPQTADSAGIELAGTKAGLCQKDDLSPILPTRILGDLAVDEDGSFQIRTPANIPIRIQVLDSDGMALRSSAWMWVRNKENRGCIGCHEDNELTPENTFAKALSHPAVPLTLPAERRRTVDFRRDVRPILAARCANGGCHGSGSNLVLQGATGGGRFDAAYESLMSRGGPGNAAAKFVHPGQARTSPLIWALMGKNTARPWDGLAPGPPIQKMPPASSPPLTPAEIQTIIEWIDLGAHWSANHGMEDTVAGRRSGVGGQ